MIRALRRMNMHVYIPGYVVLVYGPWTLVYINLLDDKFPSTGTDETCSPGVCMGATTGFWFKKTTRGLRIGAPVLLCIYKPFSVRYCTIRYILAAGFTSERIPVEQQCYPSYFPSETHSILPWCCTADTVNERHLKTGLCWREARRIAANKLTTNCISRMNNIPTISLSTKK